MNLAKKKIILFAHNSGGEGNYDDELFSYLLRNPTKSLTKVSFPFGDQSVKSIRLILSQEGKIIHKFESFIKFSNPAIISFIKDVIMGLYYGVKLGRKTDIFIGMDNLLVLVGIILKKIGIVKSVYYVVIDYTPVRYQNKILNKIYYLLDKFALYNSDMTIGLNNIMVEQRIKDHNLNKDKINYRVAPFGNYSLEREVSDYKNNKNNIVYFGGIMKSKGSELFVPIIKALRQKGYKDLRFHIIGGGDVDWLKKEIRKSKIEQFVTVYGRIEETKDIDNILLSSGIAIAPYYPEDKNNFSYFADPGKVKVYLGCGLPIVITDVPPIAKEIQKYKAGIIAKYDPTDFADKIIDVYNQYKEYNKHAIMSGRSFDWNNIFNNLFKD